MLMTGTLCASSWQQEKTLDLNLLQNFNDTLANLSSTINYLTRSARLTTQKEIDA